MLDALAQRADQIASEDLLNSINGGTQNDCHDSSSNDNTTETREVKVDNTEVDKPHYKHGTGPQ